jgi:hypothetical protein
MGSKGSGSTNTASSTSSPPPQVLAEYQAAVNRATGVANTPYTPYPGEMVAPLSNQTLQGLGGVSQYAGAAQPAISAAEAGTTAAATPVSPTQFSGQQVGQYMNPFTSQVVGTTEAEMQNQNEQQAQFLNSQNISAGAFGGDRAGIAQGVLANQQELAEAPTIAGLNQSNYNQALAEFNTQQQTGLSAEEFNQQQLGSMAAQLGTLGTAGQTAGLQGATAETQAGMIPQEEQQAVDTALENLYNQGQAYPFQTTGWLSNIIEGLGSQGGGTSTTTTPGPSTTSQAIGAGVAGLGILGSFLARGGRTPSNDIRVRENMRPVGKTFDNHTIYGFNFPGDPRTLYDAGASELRRAGFDGGGGVTNLGDEPSAIPLEPRVAQLGTGKWTVFAPSKEGHLYPRQFDSEDDAKGWAAQTRTGWARGGGLGRLSFQGGGGLGSIAASSMGGVPATGMGPAGALQMAGVNEGNAYGGRMGEMSLYRAPGAFMFARPTGVPSAAASAGPSPLNPMPAPALRQPGARQGGRIGFQGGGALDAINTGYVDFSTPLAIGQGYGVPNPLAGTSNILFSSQGQTGSGGSGTPSSAYSTIGEDALSPSEPNLSGAAPGTTYQPINYLNPSQDNQTAGAEASLAGLINRPGIETPMPGGSAAAAAPAPAAAAPTPAARWTPPQQIWSTGDSPGGTQLIGSTQGHGTPAGLGGVGMPTAAQLAAIAGPTPAAARGGRIGFQDGGLAMLDDPRYSYYTPETGNARAAHYNAPTAAPDPPPAPPPRPRPSYHPQHSAPAAPAARAPAHVNYEPGDTGLEPDPPPPAYEPGDTGPLQDDTPQRNPNIMKQPFAPEPRVPIAPGPEPFGPPEPITPPPEPPQAPRIHPLITGPHGTASYNPPVARAQPSGGLGGLYGDVLPPQASIAPPPDVTVLGFNHPQITGRAPRPTPMVEGPARVQPRAIMPPPKALGHSVFGHPDALEIERMQNEGGPDFSGPGQGYWGQGEHPLYAEGGRIRMNSGGVMGQMPLVGATGYAPQGQAVTGYDSQGSAMGSSSVARSAAGGFGGLFDGKDGREGFQDGGLAMLDPALTNMLQPAAGTAMPGGSGGPLGGVNLAPLSVGHGPPQPSSPEKQQQQQSPLGTPEQQKGLGESLKKISSKFAPAAPTMGGGLGGIIGDGSDGGFGYAATPLDMPPAPDDAGFIDASSFDMGADGGFGLGGIVRPRYADGGGDDAPPTTAMIKSGMYDAKNTTYNPANAPPVPAVKPGPVVQVSAKAPASSASSGDGDPDAFFSTDAAPASGGLGGLPTNRAQTTPAQRDAFNRAYAAKIGLNPDVASGVARAEGLGVGGAGPSSVDVEGGRPFSFGDFQLNVRNGLGSVARDQGIDPADPNQWQEANKFAIDQMKKQGLGPWKGDAYARAAFAGKAPNVPSGDAQETQATTSSPGGGYVLPGAPPQVNAALADAARPPDRKLLPPGVADSLMMAGFGMMAGTSPHAMVNIGQGAMAGMEYYQKQRQLDREWLKNEAEIEDYGSQARYRDAQTNVAVQNMQIERYKLQIAALNPGDPIPPPPWATGPAAKSTAEPAPAPTAPPAGPQAPATTGPAGKGPQAPVLAGGPGATPAPPVPAVAPPAGAPGKPAGAPGPVSAPTPAGGPATPASAQPVAGDTEVAPGVKQSDLVDSENPNLLQQKIDLYSKQARMGVPGAAALADTAQKQFNALSSAPILHTKDGRSITNPAVVAAGAAKEGAIKGQEQFDEEDREAADAPHALQQQAQRLEALQTIMKRYPTGAWSEHLGDIGNILQSFHIPINVGDPAAVAEFLKNSTGEIFDQLKEQKGAARNMEIVGLSKANPDPNLPPEANAAIISQMLGVVRERQDYYKNYVNWRQSAEGQSARSPTMYSAKWGIDHPIQPYIDKEEKNFAYAGQKLPPKGRRTDGQAYMMPDGRVGRWDAKSGHLIEQ